MQTCAEAGAQTLAGLALVQSHQEVQIGAFTSRVAMWGTVIGEHDLLGGDALDRLQGCAADAPPAAADRRSRHRSAAPNRSSHERSTAISPPDASSAPSRRSGV